MSLTQQMLAAVAQKRTGSAPFVPPANLVFAVEPSGISGLSDNTTITSWVDPFNGGNSLTNTTGSPKKQTSNGLAVAQLTIGQVLGSNSIFGSSFNQSLTVIYVAFADARGANQTAICQGTGIFGGIALTEQDTGALRYNAWYPNTSGTGLYSAGQIVTYRYDGTNIQISRNTFHGSAVAKSSGGDLGLTGAVKVGSDDGFGFTGKFMCLYVFDRVLSDNEVDAMCAHISPLVSGFTGNDTYLMMLDSQMGTNGGSGATTIPLRLASNLAGGSVAYNYMWNSAASGRKIQDYLDNNTLFTGEVDPRVQLYSTAQYQTAVILGGQNDVDAGVSGATVSGRLDALMTGLTARGVNRFALVGCPPSTTDDGSKTTAKATYNTHMSGLASSSVKYIPIQTDPRMADPSDTTYYFTDGVHFNDAGKNVVGDLIYAAINPW